MVYKYGCNAMRKGSSVCHILVFNSQPTQRAVCVCRRAQLFFYLGTRREEEEGEQVAYQVLGCRDQQVASEPYGVVLAQRLNDGWRRFPGV